MKKVLLTLSSVVLLAASVSAQIQIDKFNAMPTSGSLFGKDEVGTINFDTAITLFHEDFDTSANSFTNSNFDGFGGTFMWDTSLSIHSSHVFETPDGSGFVIMNSDALGANDTQRVNLTGTSFSTMGYNRMTMYLNHFYSNSANDSIAAIMLSINGTNWTVLKNYAADSADFGAYTSFGNDTLSIPSVYLNKPTVYVRFVYATTEGMHWAINDLRIIGEKFTPSYATFAPGPNKTWDVTNIMYDGGVKYYSRKSAPAPYRFIDSLYNEELLALQHTTYGLNYFTVTGIHEWGQLTYDQSLSLAPLTGNTADSLIVPVQPEIEYSNVHNKIVYPCTYNTKWKSDFWFLSSFWLRGPSFNLNDRTTVRRFTEVSQRDTVVGWGKMRVKSVGGNIESYIDVLQIKTVYTQRDSFYLFGLNQSSADSIKRVLFKNFMANNGLGVPVNTTNYTKFSFMRIGEITPLVSVFMNDTFINRIEVHKDHPWPLDVENASMTEEAVRVFPNPVVGREVNISFAAPQAGNWNCDVLNVMGQVIISKALDINAGTSEKINLPSSVSPGTYYLRFSRNGEPMSVKAITVKD